MSAATTIGAALALPLGGAILTAILSRRPNLREGATLIVGAALLAVVVSLLPTVLDGGRPELALLEILPGLALAFHVEPLGMLFSLVVAGLWIVTTCYSIGYMRGHHEKHQTRFYVCFALAIAGALGVAFSRNLLTLFVCYEFLTLSTYPLVTHHGTARAMSAGRVYLGILLSSSIAFLLLAIAWTWTLTGTLEFTPGGILRGKAGDAVIVTLLVLYVFGTGKAAVMPLHRWLPAAMVAPTPVSALLHAVAVVKAGVFSILKIVIYIFGTGWIAEQGLSVWMMYAAAATILIASLVALTRDNLKERLAYSTIGQLSYIVLGAALANSWSLVGGAMHIAMHALGKITLFFCAGAILVATHKTRVSEMRGIGRTMPVTLFAFLVGSLSIIGLPPMGGSWSKWFLVLGAAEGHQAVMVVVLLLSTLLSIGYLMPVVIRAFFLPRRDSGNGESTETAIREAPMFCVVPLSLTAAGCLILFFLADPIYRLLLPIVSS